MFNNTASRIKQEHDVINDFWESTEYQSRLNSFVNFVRSGLHFSLTPAEKKKLEEVEALEFKPTPKPYSMDNNLVEIKNDYIVMKAEPYEDSMVVEVLEEYQHELPPEDFEFTPWNIKEPKDDKHLDPAFVPYGERMALCHVCGVFVKFRRRRDHSHLAQKVVYFCHFCGHAFNGRKPLRAHLFVKHVPSKAIPCEVCGKLMGDTVRLRLHMISHRREVDPDFARKSKKECPICHKWVVAIKQHMDSHDDNRKFKCPNCTKAFNSKNHLQQHLAVHTNVKLFQCRFCTATFGFFSSQRNHEKRIHGE